MSCKKSLPFLLAFLFVFLVSFGQNTTGKEKYWIFLTDKGDISHFSPEQILSPRSLERRANMGIPLDLYDYPVNRVYVQHLANMGLDLRQKSKWLNGVSAWLSPQELLAVQALPFVRGTKMLMKYRLDLGREYPVAVAKTAGGDTSATYTQNKVLKLDSLHKMVYAGDSLQGKGVIIAVLDNGFRGADSMDCFARIHNENRVIATHDFVDGDADVYDYTGQPNNFANHGTWVWSIMSGYVAGSFCGAAPQASFILCRTENDASETHQEEDNWAAGAEYADSIGADIFSTSLGYSAMDSGVVSYTYADMDGNTAIISIAADRAASRGILVVNSAGNEGNGPWYYIIAPADGDSVMAVGAVQYINDTILPKVGFSSVGPSSDGQLKPDVTAVGSGVAFMTKDNTVSFGGGTSFSCPQISGFAACLLQSAPGTSNMDLYQIIIQCADRYTNPDTAYGYGIPNALCSYQALQAIARDELIRDESGVWVYPVPVANTLNISFAPYIGSAYQTQLEIFDLQGKRIASRVISVSSVNTHFAFDKAELFPGLTAGIYLLNMTKNGENKPFFSRKIILND